MTVIAEREYTIPLIDVIPRRELKEEGEVNVMSPTPNIRWDYFTLYNQGGIVLARSGKFAKNTTIRLTYRGITFIASPGYDDSEISIDFDSLLTFINDNANE